MFAGILLLVAGVLNVIWGFAAIGGAKFFVADQKYIISGLHTWGWVMLILGVIELIAGFSLFSGRGLRPLGRHLRRCTGLDQRAAVDSRLSVSGRCASSPCR